MYSLKGAFNSGHVVDFNFSPVDFICYEAFDHFSSEMFVISKCSQRMCIFNGFAKIIRPFYFTILTRSFLLNYPTNIFLLKS